MMANCQIKSDCVRKIQTLSDFFGLTQKKSKGRAIRAWTTYAV